VHHFLGNAADVDTGATELPRGADGRRLDEVSDSNLLAELSSSLGGREAA